MGSRCAAAGVPAAVVNRTDTSGQTITCVMRKIIVLITFWLQVLPKEGQNEGTQIMLLGLQMESVGRALDNFHMVLHTLLFQGIGQDFGLGAKAMCPVVMVKR